MAQLSRNRATCDTAIAEREVNKAYRRLVMEMIGSEVIYHPTPTGEVDKPGLQRAVYRRLTVEQPVIVEDMRGMAFFTFLDGLIEYFIRHDKGNFAMWDREAKVGKAMRRWVQVPPGQGSGYVLKRRIDVTKDEAVRLTEYHKGMGRAHNREADWWEEIVWEMESRGLAGDAPCSLVVTETEIEDAAA